MSILDEGRVSSDLERSLARTRAARARLEEKAARGEARLRAGAKTRKSAATRERIMDAATELMMEHNGTDFQMSEVSARCNMSKGSLYYYFADKDALVQAIYDQAVDDLVGQIERAVANAPSALASFVRVAETISECAGPHSPLALALTRELLDAKQSLLPSVETRLTPIVAIFEAQIDRAKAEGLMRRGVNSRLGAVSIVGAFVFAILGGVVEDSEKDAGEFAQEFIELLLAGMGTEEAKAQLAEAAAAAEPRPDAPAPPGAPEP